jgi:hypothetical protein
MGWDFFKCVRCWCTCCGETRRIPVRRIRAMERYLGVKKDEIFIWECHTCHEGVVIPGKYVNSFGETVQIEVKNLDPNTPVFRF